MIRLDLEGTIRRPAWPLALILFCSSLGWCWNSAAQSNPASAPKALVDYINPMIGAGCGDGIYGKTFPGAATPFGLVQLSPDTVTGGDNGCGYSYPHKTIEGFSFTHMSGVGWYGDLGNFLVMPTVGALKTERGVNGAGDGYRSRFSHTTEVAQAGYYAVTLDDYQVRAELTAAPRAGILRFTFPQSGQSRIQIDLARRVGGTSTRQYVKVVDDHTIEGWMKCPPAGGGWGNGDGKADYTVYFVAEFSLPMTQYGVWSADIPAGWRRKREDIESARYREVVAAAKVLAGCRGKGRRSPGILHRIRHHEPAAGPDEGGHSLSSASTGRGATCGTISRTGTSNECAGKPASSGRMRWPAWPSKAPVMPRRKSSLPRSTIRSWIRAASRTPMAFIPGPITRFTRPPDYTYRTIFSGWDVFRSQYPLLSILRPDVVNDTVNSLMQQAELSGNGYLARWEIVGAESGCMIGDPAVSVIADAYLKGIRGYDAQQAYTLCRELGHGTEDRPAGFEGLRGQGLRSGQRFLDAREQLLRLLRRPICRGAWQNQ